MVDDAAAAIVPVEAGEVRWHTTEIQQSLKDILITIHEAKHFNGD
jgi:hypothetical protein